MAQRIVDGLALPVAVAGHPALELCNTIAGWTTPHPKDYLRSYDHLAVLAGAIGLLPEPAVGDLRERAAGHHNHAARVVREAGILRSCLYAAITGAGLSAATIPELNRQLQRAAAARQIRLIGREGPVWDFAGHPELRQPLLRIAWAAYDLLDSAASRHVRRCPGHGCGWLFLDARGTRRWCIMAICGNRAKASRFAARRRHGGAGSEPSAGEEAAPADGLPAR